MKNPFKAGEYPVDDAKVYVNQTSYWHLTTGNWPLGARLRGSHPAVQASPMFWIEDGLSDDEIAAIRQARHIVETRHQ